MRPLVTVIAIALATLGAACGHQFAYVPVGPGAAGGAAARFGVPPAAPQGEVYVTSFGYTDLDAGRLLHARVAVSNGSGLPWSVDGRQQQLALPGQPPQPPAFLNTNAGQGPVYVVAPGASNVFDLYYAAPPPYDRPEQLGGFDFDWRVDVGGLPVVQRTSFQRMDGPPPSYAPYPPYVVVGLGFGVGWWYGPGYIHRHHYPPVIRHHYGPRPAPGGGWRGAPPSGGGWRGSPPSGGGGGWRGSPPSSAPRRGWRGR